MQMNDDVHLRPATAEDRPLLEHWDTQEHVIASGGEDAGEWEWEAELGRSVPWREQLIIAVGDRAIGFVQIIDPLEEETHYWGDVEPHLRAIDIWIGEADALGRGYGSAAMQSAIARCFDDPRVTAILIDPLESNVRARRFYARHGFEEVGPRRFGGDDCMVMRLTRQRAEQVTDRRSPGPR
jgi:aminoglycoside 6'-N-acetyltransferase